MPRQPAIPTRHVRVAEDLARKLGEILDIENDTNAAEWLDPLIRREIENRHAQYLPAIQAMRAAQEHGQRIREEIPELASDLGESGA